jgi:hypothetical protein
MMKISENELDVKQQHDCLNAPLSHEMLVSQNEITKGKKKRRRLFPYYSDRR